MGCPVGQQSSAPASSSAVPAGFPRSIPEQAVLDMQYWTLLDFVFVAIAILSTAMAFFKGIARELISLGALIAGFILAALYYPLVGSCIADLTSSESVANLAGFMIIFLSCLVAGGIIAFIVKRTIKMASLDWIDRTLGGIFGFIRGWAICSIIVLALIAFPVRETRLAQSYLGPYVLAGASGAVLMVPQDLKEKFHQGYKRILQALNQSGDRS
jgi:membrane protein required for colicin V production